MDVKSFTSIFHNMHREEAREEEPVKVGLQDEQVIFSEDSLNSEKEKARCLFCYSYRKNAI